MTHHYHHILFILLTTGAPLLSMKKEKKESIDTQLVKFYQKKVGTEKILKQLEKARPDEEIDHPEDFRSYRLVRAFPSLTFTLYFTRNIKDATAIKGFTEEEKEFFNTDEHLNRLIFEKIDTIETEGGYRPESTTSRIYTESLECPYLVTQTCATNHVDHKTDYYHEKDSDRRPFVKCVSSFEYEDIKRIKEIVQEK